MNNAERERLATEARLKVARRRSALGTAKHYQQELKQTEEMLTLAIAAAISMEATWQEVGELLGVTAEQARERYGSVIHDPYEKMLQAAKVEETDPLAKPFVKNGFSEADLVARWYYTEDTPTVNRGSREDMTPWRELAEQQMKEFRQLKSIKGF